MLRAHDLTTTAARSWRLRFDRSRQSLWLLLAAAALPLLPARTAGAKPGPDPAERGLDLFVHAAPRAIAGDTLALDFLAYGFPSVTVARPLPNAEITAAWDPETLGPNVGSAPADLTAATDALGRARLEIPVPPGDARKISLLVALRHGEHVRTRAIEIQRTPRAHVEVRVPDAFVVPGSQVPAWVTVTDTRTGGPIGGASVDLALLEGDVDRATERVTTDGSGLARASFFVPTNASGTPRLVLRARLADATNRTPVESTVALGLREETPATPRLLLEWAERELKPAELGHARARVLDATDEPIANHPVVYWTGAKGTSPPTTDDEWKKHGKLAKTDGLGQLSIEAQAPRVVTALGSELTVLVRTEIEGQKLEVRRTLPVGQPVATATLSMESGEVVPGLVQRAWLHVSDGERGVAGDFTVEADGLRTTVTTDARGDAELSWPVPEDIGARREKGPCAGGVAAAVVVRQAKPVPALARHPEPFELCVNVARERSTLLRTSTQVARVGDKVRATVIAARRATSGPGSVVVTGPEGFGATSFTAAADGTSPVEAEVDLSGATAGIHDITVAIPQAAKGAQTSAARILVIPRVLPKLDAKLASTRLVPGGEAEIEARLHDGHGAPIVGTVTAVVIDKEGGGSVAGLERLDTRLWLCAQAGAPRELCDAFLEGDPSVEGLRRSTLTTQRPDALGPLLDPAAHATEALKKTFSDVLHSLEGAVFEARTPESLRDVRRKENGGWVFNPELMSLVTAAMSEPPTTPGGEPFGLADLLAVDPQVTFDAVARRVTRLKLFNVLSAVRTYKQTEQLDDDEPALRDPNALLRRLVRDGTLSQDDLLDPWGGTMEFVKTGGPVVPFLTAARGFALHAPGPDGRLGTADDVKDPFERVVRSNTPYATAMGEDEIVDAKWDMRVGDATVSSWQSMFARLTGTSLGQLSGTGSGGGFGSGHGRLGGSHATKSPTMRSGSAIATQTTRFTDPVRTDAQGRAKIRVRLGDHETTWRIALLARSDAGQSATNALDAPVSLPVSARVDVGRKLTVGDEISARFIVRNRTSAPKPVTLDLSAEGGLLLQDRRVLSVEVPPNAVRSVFARVRAATEGRGRLAVVLRAPGTEGDRTVHDVAIAPAGEPRIVASTWTASASRATRRGALRVDVPPGYALRDNARLVLETGTEDALLAALASVEPESGMPPEALADAIEIAARVGKIAESQGKHWLVTRTRKLAALARAHLEARPDEDRAARERAAVARATLFAPPPPHPSAASPRRPAPNDEEAACPKDADLEAAPIAVFLEAEPPPKDTGPLACFTTLLSRVPTRSALDLARAAHALFDRPHRAPLATTLARELARVTRADTGGEPVIEGARAERAVVLSALARSAHTWAGSPDAGRRFLESALALRDARGGYGSTEATRDVVRALVASEPVRPVPTRVVVRDGATGRKQVVDVGPNATVTLPLGAATTSADVEVTGGGPLVARLERPALRQFVAARDTTVAPLSVSVDWPNDARADSTGVVHLTYKNALGRNAEVWTRLPLPPGVELAAPVKDAKLRQGVVHVRRSIGVAETISLPVRFTLPGKTLVPEAETRVVSEEAPRALTPARTLVVR